MIRVVICDVGDMLLRYKWQMVLARLARLSGKEPDDVNNIIGGNMHGPGSIIYEHDFGTLTTGQFISALRTLLKIGSEVPDQLLRAAFMNYFELSGDTRRLLHFLKGTYTLGIISNMNPLQWKYITDTFPTLNENSGVFSFRVLSYEELMVKPDWRIYQLAFQRACLAAGEKFNEPLLPRNCVFLDDRPENIEAARAFGMKGGLVHRASYSDIAMGLQALGVPLPSANYRPDMLSAPSPARVLLLPPDDISL